MHNAYEIEVITPAGVFGTLNLRANAISNSAAIKLRLPVIATGFQLTSLMPSPLVLQSVAVKSITSVPCSRSVSPPDIRL
jgi:hypothetical protein